MWFLGGGGGELASASNSKRNCINVQQCAMGTRPNRWWPETATVAKWWNTSEWTNRSSIDAVASTLNRSHFEWHITKQYANEQWHYVTRWITWRHRLPDECQHKIFIAKEAHRLDATARKWILQIEFGTWNADAQESRFFKIYVYFFSHSVYRICHRVHSSVYRCRGRCCRRESCLNRMAPAIRICWLQSVVYPNFHGSWNVLFHQISRSMLPADIAGCSGIVKQLQFLTMSNTNHIHNKETKEVEKGRRQKRRSADEMTKCKVNIVVLQTHTHTQHARKRNWEHFCMLVLIMVSSLRHLVSTSPPCFTPM